MKLERRLKRLEAALAKQEEKRVITMLEVFALRAAFIGFTATLSAVSDDQYAAAKARAQDRLASYLMGGGFQPEASEEALAELEDLFYEIDAARNAADQMPEMPS